MHQMPHHGEKTTSFSRLAVVCIFFCILVSSASCREKNIDAEGDAAVAGPMTITVRNPGPGPAYLDGSLRFWCQTVFGLHRVDTGDRLLLPNASLCRCDDCEATACTGMVSWYHFYIELPEGSVISYTWDRSYLGEPSPPDSCGEWSCYESKLSQPQEHEVRVSYSRNQPVCSVGEEPTVWGDFLTPPGLDLPQEAVLHQCVDADTNECAIVPLSASARFQWDAVGVEVVLND